MSREVPFNPDAICDVCQTRGAFDFMGDCICQSCIDQIEASEADIDDGRVIDHEEVFDEIERESP